MPILHLAIALGCLLACHAQPVPILCDYQCVVQAMQDHAPEIKAMAPPSSPDSPLKNIQRYMNITCNLLGKAETCVRACEASRPNSLVVQMIPLIDSYCNTFEDMYGCFKSVAERYGTTDPCGQQEKKTEMARWVRCHFGKVSRGFQQMYSETPTADISPLTEGCDQVSESPICLNMKPIEACYRAKVQEVCTPTAVTHLDKHMESARVLNRRLFMEIFPNCTDPYA